MRHSFIVTYDICDPKRLRKVFKLCKGYGVHLQFSVFECDLSSIEKIAMETQLREIIHSGEDQILFIDLGLSNSRGELAITSVGQSYTRFDLPCFVA